MREERDYPENDTPHLVLRSDARPNGLHATFALLPHQRKWWVQVDSRTGFHWCCSHQKGLFARVEPLVVLANYFEFHGPFTVQLANTPAARLLEQWKDGLNGPRDRDPFEVHDAYYSIKDGILDEVTILSDLPSDHYFNHVTTCATEHFVTEGEDGLLTIGPYLRRIMAP